MIDLKKNRQLAILHYSAPRRVIGGVEIVIEHHAELLANRSYDVHIIYGEGGNLENDKIVEHQIPLLSANHPDILSLQDELLEKKAPNTRFQKIKKLIKSELVQILSNMGTCIVHNIPSMPFNFAATSAINELAEEMKCKFIFWLHDSILFRGRIQRTFPYTLLHHKISKVKYVVPTEYRALQFKNIYEPYQIPITTVVPNGINVEDYIKIDKVTKLLMRKLDLTFEDYILLTPVRVTPRKNIELALFVVDELRRLISDMPVKLLITGPPDHQAKKLGITYLDYLQGLIKNRDLQNNVIFCDDIINHDRKYKDGKILKWSVADVYNVADIIFIPSKEEGFGLPVIEAGAARRPIFCSRIPPFQELIRDDIEGFMFNLDENPKNIALRIYRFFLTDRVESNFNNVTNRFSWDVIIDKKLIPLL
jgi:glycosyltransferase involved in cell wall biosynthesis